MIVLYIGALSVLDLRYVACVSRCIKHVRIEFFDQILVEDTLVFRLTTVTLSVKLAASCNYVSIILYGMIDYCTQKLTEDFLFSVAHRNQKNVNETW